MGYDVAKNEARYAENYQNLVKQGVNESWLKENYGKAIENKARGGIMQAWQAVPGQQAQQQISDISSQQYSFDPNQYLPGIQQQASSIYDPQQAQLEAIRQLQSSQYQDTRLQTTQDFDKQLTTEIESINNRGAYFSGGAIEREQEIGDTKLRALNQLGLQAQAADFNNLAQQGLLAAEESQFIQDRLYNAESGAYARWSDQRNFSYQAAVQQYQVYASERDFARNVFESDRSYDMSVEQMDMQQKEFEQTYNMNKEEFEMAKEEWNLNMEIKGWNYEQSLSDFKEKYDNNDYFPGMADYRATYFNDDNELTGYDSGTQSVQLSSSGLTYGF